MTDIHPDFKKRILIVGAYGLLGSILSKRLLIQGEYIFRCGPSSTSDYCFDASDVLHVESIVQKLSPDIVINLSAITNVDYCEIHKEEASKINTLIPTILAEMSALYNYKLIHISSDQVYNGQGPHLESLVDPVNVYAKTKLAGEFPVIENNGIVLRTNFVGRSLSSKRKSFTDWLFDKASSPREQLTLFDDVIFTPLHMNQLTNFIRIVISNFKPGCYNVGSSDSITKSSFGLKFLGLLDFELSKIDICSYNDSSLSTKRPLDMSLNLEKTKQVFNWNPPSISETIAECVNEYTYKLI